MPSRRPIRSAKTATELARRGPTRHALKRFLIVCEGSKTEPQYFRALARSLRLTTADVIVCGEECSSDPVSVVRYAYERFMSDQDIDHVFCVIDKDSHTNLTDALNIARDAKMPPEKTFRTILSVPCFEFWVLLHFEYSTAPYNRSGSVSPCDALIAKIKSKHADGYSKGDDGLFDALRERYEEAKRRSVRALQAAKDNGTDNPSTEIHLLIDMLEKAIEPAKIS